ncbi:MAG: DUF4873 domain-containing protein [Actinomycetales bacterium]
MTAVDLVPGARGAVALSPRPHAPGSHATGAQAAGAHGTGELEDHDDGYQGGALLVTADHEIAVVAALRGFFQSVDGRYRWHGRLAAPADTPDALDVLAGARHQAVLVTPDGMSRCDIYEQDLWGRFKVSGVGRPPFAVDTTLPDED